MTFSFASKSLSSLICCYVIVEVVGSLKSENKLTTRFLADELMTQFLFVYSSPSYQTLLSFDTQYWKIYGWASDKIIFSRGLLKKVEGQLALLGLTGAQKHDFCTLKLEWGLFILDLTGYRRAIMGHLFTVCILHEETGYSGRKMFREIEEVLRVFWTKAELGYQLRKCSTSLPCDLFFFEEETIASR